MTWRQSVHQSVSRPFIRLQKPSRLWRWTFLPNCGKWTKAQKIVRPLPPNPERPVELRCVEKKHTHTHNELSSNKCDWGHILKTTLLGPIARHVQGLPHRQGRGVLSEGGQHARLPQSLHDRPALRQQQRLEFVLHHGRVFPPLRARRRETQGVEQTTVW